MLDGRTFPKTWVVEWDRYVTANHGRAGGHLQAYGHVLDAAERMCTPDEVVTFEKVEKYIATQWATSGEVVGRG